MWSDFVTRIITRYAKDEELKRLLMLHSECVAKKALQVVSACGIEDKIDRQFVVDASMLHDIGISRCDAPSIHCFGTAPYIRHGVEGALILKKEGLDEKYCRVCERHTGSGLTAKEIKEQHLPLPLRDYIPETLEEKLICYADKFYSKSGDPSSEKPLEKVEASMKRHGGEAWERFVELREQFTPVSKPASDI